MIYPEVKLFFPVVGEEKTFECGFWVPIEVDIGPKDKDSADMFTFYVVDFQEIENLLKKKPALILRGMIIVEEWNESVIKDGINNILMKCAGETWEEVAHKINKFGIWEYEF